jgi:hypothetical protein
MHRGAYTSDEDVFRLAQITSVYLGRIRAARAGSTAVGAGRPAPRLSRVRERWRIRAGDAADVLEDLAGQPVARRGTANPLELRLNTIHRVGDGLVQLLGGRRPGRRPGDVEAHTDCRRRYTLRP